MSTPPEAMAICLAAFSILFFIGVGAVLTICLPRPQPWHRQRFSKPTPCPASRDREHCYFSERFLYSTLLSLNEFSVFKFAVDLVRVSFSISASATLAIFRDCFRACYQVFARTIEVIQRELTVFVILLIWIGLLCVCRWYRTRRISKLDADNKDATENGNAQSTHVLWKTTERLFALDRLEDFILLVFWSARYIAPLHFTTRFKALLGYMAVIRIVFFQFTPRPTEHLPELQHSPKPSAVGTTPRSGSWQHMNDLINKWKALPVDMTERYRRVQISRRFVEAWNKANKTALKLQEDLQLKKSISLRGNLATENHIEDFLKTSTQALQGILLRSRLFAEVPKVGLLGKRRRTVDVIARWLLLSDDTAESKRRRLVLDEALAVWETVLVPGLPNIATIEQAAIIRILRGRFSCTSSTPATFEKLLATSVRVMKGLRLQLHRIREAMQRIREQRQRRGMQPPLQRPPKPRWVFPRNPMIYPATIFIIHVRPLDHIDPDGRSSLHGRN